MENQVTLITPNGVDHWPRMDKQEIARKLAVRIAEQYK
jgi:phosphopantothenoylcysteine decarboxylase/phosphopantothenate--cysteine ligase